MGKLDALGWEKVSEVGSIEILLIKAVNCSESVDYVEILTLALYVFHKQLDSFRKVNFCVQNLEHSWLNAVR